MTSDSRSLGIFCDGDDPVLAVRQVRALGLGSCELHGIPAAYQKTSDPNTSGRFAALREALAETGVLITAHVCQFERQDYSDVAAVARTVGYVPEGERAVRIALSRQAARTAAQHGISMISTHAGFLLPSNAGESYPNLVAAVEEVAAACAEVNVKLALETGQETAGRLLEFIGDVGRDNVGVSFDPANFLLYDMQEPLEALDVLRERILTVHLKDGRRPTEKGRLGQELPLGEGDVNIPAFLRRLRQTGYTGPFTIECELGEGRDDAVRKAIDLARSLLR
jgi:L-ribulose-5-phosphate 3-epimerase